MKNTNVTKVLGYILLTPALFSVVAFVVDLLNDNGGNMLYNLTYTVWLGSFGGNGGGYTSALPFYFGLMAIAGAYLIKDSKKD